MRSFPRSLEIDVVRNSLKSRWCVVHKPAGFAMSQSRHYLDPSLQSILSLRGVEQPRFPYRLDVDTGGLVIVTQDEHLSATIGEGTVERRYRAVADLGWCGGVDGRSGCASRGVQAGNGARGDARGSRFHAVAGDLGCERGRLASFVRNAPDRMLGGRKVRSLLAESRSACDVGFDNLVELVCESEDSAEVDVGAAAFAAGLVLEGEPSATSSEITSSRSERELVIPEDAAEHFSFQPAVPDRAEIFRRKHSLKSRGRPADETLNTLDFRRLHVDEETKTALYDVTVVNPVRHQVRVQFAEAGCPIVGDRYYHPRWTNKIDQGHVVGGGPLRSGDHCLQEDHCSDDSLLLNEEDDVDWGSCRTSRPPLALQLYGLRFLDPCDSSRLVEVALEEPGEWEDLY